MADEKQCEFTEQELKELRELLETERRVKWLRSTIRNILVWMVGVVGGLTFLWQSLKDAVSGLTGGGH